ncbi:MAG TPA: hypothetical protein VF607_16930, partial [Verrucomicrobiae bacterium]
AADPGNCTILRIGPDGQASTIAGGAGDCASLDGPLATARLKSPYALAFDGAKNLIVATSSGMKAITPDGWSLSMAGPVLMPSGIAAGPDGLVYYLDQSQAITGFRLGEPIRKVSPYARALSAAFDSEGTLFAIDVSGSAIKRIRQNQLPVTIAGSEAAKGAANGFGSAARFGSCSGIAVAANGYIYITDYAYHTIRLGRPAASLIPKLGLVQANGRPALSWPVPEVKVVLKTSPSLGMGAVWSVALLSIENDGKLCYAQLEESSPEAYYRLRYNE